MGTPSSQTVTIVDTDAPPVATLSVVSTSINETTGTTSTLVTATLSLMSAKTVTVTLANSGTATDVSDYTLSSTITIPPGSTTGSVTLVAVDESPALDEVDETVILTMSCDTTCSVGTPSSQMVTIVDQDLPPVATLSVVSTSTVSYTHLTLPTTPYV